MNNDDFEALLNANIAPESQIRPGDKVEGTAVSIGKEYVFFDIGLRTEAVVPIEEFTADGTVSVSVGDTVPLTAQTQRDGSVLCTTGRRAHAVDSAAGQQAVWEQLVEAQEAQMPVDGHVTASNKGGFEVTVAGIRGFCPVSQIDTAYCDDPSVHVGRTYRFAIAQVDPARRNLVLSRKQLLQREQADRAAQLWDALQVGDTLDGTVQSLKPYGAFVDIGGVQGLLHVSELSFSRISHPSDVLREGDSIRVQVIAVDRDARRISLSLKALQSDPWDTFVAQNPVGKTFEGTISKVAEFGVFVDIAEGVTGLAHVSTLRRGDDHTLNVRKAFRSGQALAVRVLSLDPETRKVSLAPTDYDPDAQSPDALPDDYAPPSGSLGTLGDLLRTRRK